MANPAECSADPVLFAPQESLKLVLCSAWGIPVAVRTTADLLDLLPSPLIPGAALDSSPGGRTLFEFLQMLSANGERVFTVTENGARIFALTDAVATARALESRIHQEVAAQTDQAVFVHAGVVRWNGKALVLPGASHSGKSTLTAALVAAGATYYSDEYAVLDLEGRIHAFPRQLRLRDDIAAASYPVPSLPRNHSLDPLQLGWVLNVRYTPNGIWEPVVLTPGQTLLALLQNTVAVRRQSEVTVRTLRRAIEGAAGWQSRRADAVNAAQAILRLIDESPDVNDVDTTQQSWTSWKGTYDESMRTEK